MYEAVIDRYKEKFDVDLALQIDTIKEDRDIILGIGKFRGLTHMSDGIELGHSGGDEHVTLHSSHSDLVLMSCDCMCYNGDLDFTFDNFRRIKYNDKPLKLVERVHDYFVDKKWRYEKFMKYLEITRELKIPVIDLRCAFALVEEILIQDAQELGWTDINLRANPPEDLDYYSNNIRRIIDLVNVILLLYKNAGDFSEGIGDLQEKLNRFNRRLITQSANA